MIQGFLSIKKTLLASLFTLTFLGVGVLFTSAAPAPSVISYQGFLTSATGTAQTGTTTVTVRFYDASAGGVLLFEELHPTVPVTNGYFTIQVGSVGDVNGGTVASAITDLSFDRSYYFTVELDAPFSTGEMTLAGGTRSQLGSVPFAKVAYGALQATSSTGLTTEKGRMYFNTGDNQLYIYNGTSWSPLSVQSSTFSTLTVTGTTSLQAASTTALSVVGQTTLNTASATGITSTNIYGTNGVITNATATNLFASEATFTNSTSSTFFATLLNAVTAVITNLTATNATATNLVTTNSTSTNLYSAFLNTIDSVISNLTFTNATGTNLSTLGTTTLATNGGYVGIGTTTPQKLLDIFTANENDNQIRFLNTSSSSSSYAEFRISNDTVNTYIGSANTNYSDPNFAGRGWVYNGTHNSGLNLMATGLNSDIRLFTRSGSGGTLERMRVSSTGNVGIGTTTPTSLLSVAGSFRLTGAFSDSTNASGTLGQLLWSTGTSTLWVSTSSLGITGGAGVTGGVPGFATRWLSSTTLGTSTLLDNGTVLGINATSSSVTFNIQGTSGTDSFRISSSTGTTLLTLNQRGSLLLATSTPTFDNSTLVVQGTTTLIGTTGARTALRVAGNIDNTATSTFQLITATTTSTGGVEPRDLYINGNYAYVVNQNSDSLSILDISNPKNPFLIATSSTGDTPKAVYVSGYYAYVTNFLSGTLSVFDVSNPASPSVISTVNVDDNPNSVYVAGSYAYVTNRHSNTLSVIDVSNQYNPIVISSIPTGGSQPHAAFVLDGYVYVTHQFSNSLSIFNIHNPKNTIFVASTTVVAGPVDVHVSGRYAYVAGMLGDGLSIVDISNKSAPSVVSTVSLGGEPYSVYISGRYAYVANRSNDSVSLIDISNPLSPEVISEIETGDTPSSLFVIGRYVYVTSETDNFLSVIDIGGLESTSASIHSLEAGNLAVRNDIQIGGQLLVNTGLTIGGGGFQSQGSASIYGSLSVGTSTYQQFFVNAANNTTNIGTSTGLASLFIQGTSTLNAFVVASSTGESMFGVDSFGRVILGNDDNADKNIFINGGPAYAYPSLRNIAIGHEAFAFASTTSINDLTDNIAIGYRALHGSSTDSNNSNSNIAIGSDSMFSNITGYSNVAVGMNSLSANISGAFNLALGQESLFSNISGDSNVALGYGALLNNLSGDANIAIGDSAMNLNTTGSRNTVVGNFALYNNESGSYNVALGEYAGVGEYANDVGSVLDNYSGFIGYKAARDASLASSTELSNAWAIGREARVGQSNTIVFGSSATTTIGMNVGIGTSTPRSRLDIYTATSTATVDMFRIISDVSSSNNVVFKVTANGDVFTDGNTTIGTPADLAENYPTEDPTIKPGMVVSLSTTTITWSQSHPNGSTTDYEIATVKKAARGEEALGVISTRPGILLGGNTEKGIPVAFSGRVPVYVTGEVSIGDSLTISTSTLGYAMKQTENDYIIGRAISSSQSGATSSLVMMIVENKQKTVNLEKVSGLIYLATHSSETSPSVTVRDTLLMRLANGYGVVKEYIAVSISAVTGYFDKIFAKEIYSDSVDTKVICLGEGVNKTCVTKEKLDALLLLDLGGQKNQNNGEIDEVNSEAGGSSSGLSGDLEEGIINGTSTEGGTISNENSTTSTDSIP